MRVRVSLAIVCLLSALTFTGCSSTFEPETAVTTQTPLGTLQGSAFGGRSPITSAHIFVFAASTNGYGITTTGTNGAGSPSLLVNNANTTQDLVSTDLGYGDYYVTTDANGAFSITGDYTCTSGTQVYLYSSGGIAIPGGAQNPQASLMALLGQCPASGTLAGSIGYIYMNEVSTVAAAYAIAGFGYDPVHIGSGNTALGKAGLATAFTNAAQLYNLFAPPNPSIISSSGARSTTPGSGTNGGTGTVPQTELNTLANFLVACINSANTATASTAQCNLLRAYATSNGVAGTVVTAPAVTGYSTNAPHDTATAIMNIAHHPMANISNLCALQGSGPAAAYTPALACTSPYPNDFTVGLTFTGNSLTASTGPVHQLAVDGSGNIWVASPTATKLGKFSPLGVPSVTGGYTVASMNRASSIAIDAASAYIWIANNSSTSTTVSRFTVATTASTSFPAGTGPFDVAIDGTGNIWIVNSGGTNITKLSSTGSTLATTTATNLDGPTSLAIEPGLTGVVWVANGFTSGAGNNVGYIPNTGATGYSDTLGSTYYAYGNAIDASGNIWFGNLPESAGATVSKLNAAATSGTNFALNSNTNSSPENLAIDGNGNIWVVDVGIDSLFEMSNSGTVLTPTTGVALNSSAIPASLAIDGSGNLWYTTTNDADLHELVGAAAPVATPLAYAVANSVLGTRP